MVRLHPESSALIAAVMQSASAAASQSVGPTVNSFPVLGQSVMVYLNFVLAVVALATVIWRGGRWTSKLEESEERQKDRLDGFGGRLDKHDQAEVARAARDAAHLQAVSAVATQLALMAKDVGGATAASTACNTDTAKMGKEIREQISELARDIRIEVGVLVKQHNDEARETGERLAGIEAEQRMILKHAATREYGERPSDRRA